MTGASRAAAALAALVLGVAIAGTAVAPSALADDADVTWSVRPADANGPDGRSWIEQTLNPGEHVTEHLALHNLSKITVTFAIKAADGYLTENGRFNMLPSGRESVDAGLWVEGPASVEVASGETAIVPFTLTVPANATPGDHAAGIAATVQSVGTRGDGAQVAIESRVGFPIMIRVTGELRPSLSLSAVSIEYNLSWNPFRPGRITAVLGLVNNGNVRIRASPVVTSQGRTGESDPDTPAIELLPGEGRQVTASVAGVWPLIFAPVEVTIDPTVVTLDGGSHAADSVAEDFGVWAIPFPQLFVLVGIGLIVLALLVARWRSNLRVEALVAEAREAGRQEQ